MTAIWDDIATGLNRPVDEVRRDFAAAVKRRHRIAHEADLDPSGKTPAKKRRLTKVEASALVDQVEAVGNQLDLIFGKKYP